MPVESPLGSAGHPHQAGVNGVRPAANAGTRSVSGDQTRPHSIAGSDGAVDFITGWEHEERQMPLKKEIKTPQRVADSSPISPSACLSAFVYRERRPDSFHNLDFQGILFQGAVWMPRRTPTDDSGRHCDTSHQC